jgi:hypothetical protein
LEFLTVSACAFDDVLSSGRRRLVGVESLRPLRDHSARSHSIVCKAVNGSSRSHSLNGSISKLSPDEDANAAKQTLNFKSLVPATISPLTEQNSNDVKGDPDQPTEGFSSIDEAIEAIKRGKVRITATTTSIDVAFLIIQADLQFSLDGIAVH